MSLKSEIHRLRLEASRFDAESGRIRQPKMLEPHSKVSGGTWSSTLSDEWLKELGPVDRETEIRDDIDYLSLRMRPRARPCFQFIDRDGRGRIQRKISIGFASEMLVDEARITVLKMAIKQITEGRFVKPPRLPKSATLAEAYDRYCALQSKRGRPQRNILEPLLDTLGTTRIATVKRGAILAAIRQVEFSNPNRAHRMHKSARAFLSWCLELEAIEFNPLTRAEMPARTERREVHLSIEALGRIYSAAGHLSEPWDRLIRFILLTGMPIYKARRLRRNDLIGDSLQVVAASASTRISLPLSRSAVAELRGGTDNPLYIFQTERGLRQNSAPHLRPSLLHKLRALSFSTDWTWQDLRKSVSYHLGVPAHSRLHEHAEGRKLVETWSEKLLASAFTVPEDPMASVVI